MKKLTPKKIRFCEEYVLDLNATQAYIRAGYSINGAKESASRLLTNANIKEFIKSLQDGISDKTAITVLNTVRFIKEVSEEAREEGDATNALKGADLLMKHLGGYEKDNKQSIAPVTEIKVTFVD